MHPGALWRQREKRLIVNLSSCFSIFLFNNLRIISVDRMCINQRSHDLFRVYSHTIVFSDLLAENHQPWWLTVSRSGGVSCFISMLYNRTDLAVCLPIWVL
jgi:hypothetical protein